MTYPSRQTYKFGQFNVDTGGRKLFRGDYHVPIPEKTFELLLALIERRDRVMPRDELLDLLWPQGGIDVSNLDKHISRLREAFGDKFPHQYRHIKTYHRHGYQFSAEVIELPAFSDAVSEQIISETQEEEVEKNVVAVSGRTRAVRKGRWWLWLGLALSTVGLAVALFIGPGLFKKPEILAIAPAAPLATIGDQSIVLIGRNFQKGSTVKVIYPLRDPVTLADNQVQFNTETSLVIQTDFKGHWGKHAFEIHSPYGRISAPFYFEALKHIQSPTIEAMIPESPEATNQEESIVVYGNNFGPEVIIEIIFPDERSATLQGRQIPHRTPSALTMLANFSERPGIYKVRARNANGTWCAPFAFTVH